MHKIRTYNAIAVRGLERFSRQEFEVSSDAQDPHAILLRSHKLSVPTSIPDSGRSLALARA